ALAEASRVSVVLNRPREGAGPVLRELALAGLQLGLGLIDIGVAGADELKDAVQSAARADVTALVLIDDPVIASYRPQIVPLASEAALPLFSTYADYAEEGGLIAYGPSLEAIYWRAATYVDRILRGAKPTDLPVGQPTICELVITLRTAKDLGLELAPTLLARANRVIECW